MTELEGLHIFSTKVSIQYLVLSEIVAFMPKSKQDGPVMFLQLCRCLDFSVDPFRLLSI